MVCHFVFPRKQSTRLTAPLSRALGVIRGMAAAGGPGDHPITDVLNWDLPVYGDEADAIIRRLAPLLSIRELYEFWESEIGWECKPPAALPVLRSKLRWAKHRAEESGWEA